MALQNSLPPIIGPVRTRAARRIQEGVAALGGLRRGVPAHVLASGVVAADLRHHGFRARAATSTRRP